jgi:hypothetical protein
MCTKLSDKSQANTERNSLAYPATRLRGNGAKPALQRGQVPGIALPNDVHAPSELGECSSNLAVARDVPVEFCLPEVGAGFRVVGEGAAGMSVPEAAVDEDRYLPAGQDDVGDAGKVAAVESKAKAQPVEDATDSDLGSGILPPDPRH